MPYYVLDENNNKIEAYSKEEILSVIAQAVQDGTLANIVADAGFISKIKCCVGGQTYKEAFVTQAKYNELKANNQLITNCLYNIVDDTTADDINANLESLADDVSSLEDNAGTANVKIQNLQERLNNIISDEGDEANEPFVKNADYAAQAYGASMLKNVRELVTTSTTTSVTINKAGLYACTIKLKNKYGNYYYINSFISVPDFNNEYSGTPFNFGYTQGGGIDTFNYICVKAYGGSKTISTTNDNYLLYSVKLIAEY